MHDVDFIGLPMGLLAGEANIKYETCPSKVCIAS